MKKRIKLVGILTIVALSNSAFAVPPIAQDLVEERQQHAYVRPNPRVLTFVQNRENEITIAPTQASSKSIPRQIFEFALPVATSYVVPFLVVNNAHLIGRLSFEYGNELLKIIPSPKTFLQMIEYVEIREYCGNLSQKHLSHVVSATCALGGSLLASPTASLIKGTLHDIPKAVFSKASTGVSFMKSKLSNWWYGQQMV